MRPGDYMMMVIFTFRGPGVRDGAAVRRHADPRRLRRRRHDPVLRAVAAVPADRALQPELGDRARDGRRVRARRLRPDRRVLVVPRDGAGRRAARARKARAVVESWGAPMFEHTSVGDVGTAFECPRARRPALLGGRHARRESSTRTGRAGRRPRTRRARRDRARERHHAADPLPLRRHRAPHARAVPVRAHALPHLAGRPQGRRRRGRRAHDPAHRRVARGRVRRRVRPRPVPGRSAKRRTMDRLRLRVGYGTARADARLAAVRDAVADAVARPRSTGSPDVELVPDAELLRLGPPHKIPRVAKR